MAWNEPGGGRDQDPWGNRKKEEGPPDLDELVRKVQAKFGGLFGGGRRGGGGGGSGRGTSIGVGVIVAVALVIWALTGIYIVDEAERGVVLRFGEFSKITDPGPHWHLPYPIETVEKVNVKKVRQREHRALMLTEDQNLIHIGVAVKYTVRDAKMYLFNIRDPDYTLKEASESALREVVGGRTMDEILKPGGRQGVVIQTRERLQEILNGYQAGLTVTEVNIQSTQPPDAVQDAFQDAIKAEEDQQRLEDQAEAYARDILPRAEGEAESLVQAAEAYKRQITERAKGDTSRFLQTLTEYRRAPDVTRRRLYLETMEQVLSNVSKVVVKVESGGNIMYLPLDRFIREGARVQGAYSSSMQGSSNGGSTGRSNSSGNLRTREGR